MIKKYLFQILVFIAFLIRLILMPISAHSDLLAINMFPDLIYTKQVTDILSYSKEHVHRQGFSYYPALTYFTIGAFQLPDHLISNTFSPWMTNLRGEYESGLIGQAPEFIKRSPNPMIFRDIFLAKFPYLLFDIGCIFILTKFIKNKYLSKWAVILWLFNPILIYDSYIFGQFDLIPAFFVLLGFLLLRKNSTLAILSIGIAAAYKNYALFFIPPLVIIHGDSWKERLKLLLISLAPTFIFALPTIFNQPSEAPYAVINKVLVSSKKPLAGWAFYSQILRYALLLASYFLVLSSSLTLKIKNKWILSIGLSYISLLLLLTLTTRTSFHYLFWLTPLTILWFRKIRTIIVVIGIQTLSFASYKTLASQLQMGLFAPINPDYFYSLPTINSLIDHIVPYRIISTLGFLIFLIFNLYLILRVIYELLFKLQVNYVKQDQK